MNLWKFYWRALGHLHFQAVKVVSFIVLAGLLECFTFLTLMVIFEKGMEAENEGGAVRQMMFHIGLSRELGIEQLLGVFLGSVLGSALFMFLGERALLWIRVDMEKAMRVEMSHLLFGVNWSSYLSNRIGELGKVLLQESNFAAFGAYNFLQGVAALILMPIFLTLSLIISIKMTLITIGFGILLFWVYRFGGSRATGQGRRLSESTDQMGSTSSQVFSNMKFFRSSSLSDYAVNTLEGHFEAVRKFSFNTFIYSPINKLVYMAGGAIFVAAFFYLIFLTNDQSISDGIIFLVVFQRISPRLFSANETLHQARIYVPWIQSFQRRIKELLLQQETFHGRQLPTLNSALSTTQLSYRYKQDSPLAVNRVCFTLGKGECIALVGKSGSGKSTIIDLVTGMLTPTNGQVLLDGVPLRDIDIEEWRTHIGLVPQDSPMFHDTILNNIAWGKMETDREKAQKCAELANAWSFISDLPDGLDSDVGEGGGRLSGGQRQRLALARALYRDPWLLLLDESTSSLDGVSEMVIQDALASLKGRLTILLVTHRLGITRIADRILVLDAGQIVEEGNWQDLTSRSSGYFHEILQKQEIEPFGPDSAVPH